MPRIETWFAQDLNEAVKPRSFPGSVFNNDSLGNLIGVEVTKDGEPFVLTGSVNGYCVLSNGETVPVAGTRSGNKASIVLPQTAYSVRGVIKISVKITDEQETTTLLKVVGAVDESVTGNIVNPGSVVQDWSQQIAAALQELQDAQDNFVRVDTDSQGLTETQKSNGRNNIDAASNTNFNDLKSATKTIDGSQIETDWSIGYAYKTASSVTQIQPTDKTLTTNFACISVACSEGDVFYLTGKGGGAEKLWVWLKSDGTIIDRANSNAEEESIELIAPYQAAYLLCSVYTTQKYFLISGASVDYKVNVIDGKLNEADEKNKATNYESNQYIFSDVYYGTVGGGTILQVRKSTTAYNGLIIPIPRGVQTIDLSDMTPYYVHAFTDYPVIGMTDGVQLTVTNKIVSIPVDNEYEYAIVTLKRSASGNDKDAFTIVMKKTFDERIRNLEYKINPIKSGRTLPIVCFLYDDNPSGDATLHDMLEERGLKGTFATIGNVDKDDATWKTMATRLQEWVRQGHGVVGHGLTVGVDVTILDGDTLPGLSNISDADARKAIEANNAALDAYNLPHNGIAYWNVWEDSPHTRAIVEKYYNYGFTFGGGDSGPNTLMSDLFRLTRWTTDLASHMTDAEDYVKETIGQNRLLVFGGHMNRTGTGSGSYSTMAQFTSLLNTVRDAVRNGEMISLNTDDAIRMFYGQNGNAGILSSYPYRPAVGNLVYDNGMKVCTNSGKAAFYRLTFSGTPQTGRLTIPEINIDVSVNTSDTITDVVNRIISGTMCRNYTLEKTSSTQVYCYCDKSGAMNVPTVDVNTSGLTVAVVERQTGVNPVWS